ncbi:MAG: hypothetical protein ACK56F_18970 [bacterium]
MRKARRAQEESQHERDEVELARDAVVAHALEGGIRARQQQIAPLALDRREGRDTVVALRAAPSDHGRVGEGGEVGERPERPRR